MLRCTKMSLQDSEADATALEFLPGACRALSPCWVMRVCDGERWLGGVEADARRPASNARHPAWPFVSSTLLQAVSLPPDPPLGAVVRRGPADGFTPRSSARSVQGAGNRRTQPTAGGKPSGRVSRLWAARLWTARGRTGGRHSDGGGTSATTITERLHARPGPYTGRPVRCAAPQTQQSNLL